MSNSGHKSGLYLWVEDQKGQVVSNNLFWDLSEEDARNEAERLHTVNPAIRARYIAGGKEIFKI